MLQYSRFKNKLLVLLATTSFLLTDFYSAQAMIRECDQEGVTAFPSRLSHEDPEIVSAREGVRHTLQGLFNKWENDPDFRFVLAGNRNENELVQLIRSNIGRTHSNTIEQGVLWLRERVSLGVFLPMISALIDLKLPEQATDLYVLAKLIFEKSGKSLRTPGVYGEEGKLFGQGSYLELYQRGLLDLSAPIKDFPIFFSEGFSEALKKKVKKQRTPSQTIEALAWEVRSDSPHLAASLYLQLNPIPPYALSYLGFLLHTKKIEESDEILELANISRAKLSNDRPEQVAVLLYCKAAKVGEVGALSNLGFLLFQRQIEVTDEILKLVYTPGLQLTKDQPDQIAVLLFCKAAQGGEVGALSNLGLLLSQEQMRVTAEILELVNTKGLPILTAGEKDRYKVAARLFCSAARGGDLSGVIKLASMIVEKKIEVTDEILALVNTRGLLILRKDQSYQVAARLYCKITQSDGGIAFSNLGFLLHTQEIKVTAEILALVNTKGLPILTAGEKDRYKVAARLYCKAAEQGEVSVLAKLGLLLSTQKIEVTDEILELANISRAQLIKDQPDQLAVLLYCRAAKLNEWKAYTNLADLLDKQRIEVTPEILDLVDSKGLPILTVGEKDRDKVAIHLYFKAAQGGEKNACAKLAWLIEKQKIEVSDEILKLVNTSGTQLTKNQPYQVAVRLYCEAAQGGEGSGFTNLGILISQQKTEVTPEILALVNTPGLLPLTKDQPYQVSVRLFLKSRTPIGSSNLAALIYAGVIDYDQSEKKLTNDEARFEAINRLTKDDGYGHYLKAKSHYKYKNDLQKALEHSEVALEKGYEPALPLYLRLKEKLKSNSIQNLQADSKISENSEDELSETDDNESIDEELETTKSMTEITIFSSEAPDATEVSPKEFKQLQKEQLDKRKTEVKEERERKVKESKRKLEEERANAFTQKIQNLREEKTQYIVSWKKRALNEFDILPKRSQAKILVFIDEIKENIKTQGKEEKLKHLNYKSRRVNGEDRFVYDIIPGKNGTKVIQIISCQTHYEDLK